MRIGTASLRVYAGSGLDAMTIPEAIAAMLELAEPAEPIEVSLVEAVGLVLAEGLTADVDLPPFDRAGIDGYAVHASEAAPGSLLRVGTPWGDDGHEIEPGEAARVGRGDAMPNGADAVLAPGAVRADPDDDSPRVIEVLEPTEPGRSVVRRGATLAAGSELASAGTRVRLAQVALLAAQGCVQPLCHRRVRVAIVAVGDHLVSPADEPVLHHERNAANLAVGSVLLAREAMIHDLGAVSHADFPRALDRGLHAHVVLLLACDCPAIRRALDAAHVEPVVAGVDFLPDGHTISHGVVRDPDGRIATHVLLLPLDPASSVAAATLLVAPLVARLQGDPGYPAPLRAVWDGPRYAGHMPRVVASTLSQGPDGRLHARPVAEGIDVGLSELAGASGFAIVGPGDASDLVDFLPMRDVKLAP